MLFYSTHVTACYARKHFSRHIHVAAFSIVLLYSVKQVLLLCLVVVMQCCYVIQQNTSPSFGCGIVQCCYVIQQNTSPSFGCGIVQCCYVIQHNIFTSSGFGSVQSWCSTKPFFTLHVWLCLMLLCLPARHVSILWVWLCLVLRYYPTTCSPCYVFGSVSVAMLLKKTFPIV